MASCEDYPLIVIKELVFVILQTIVEGYIDSENCSTRNYNSPIPISYNFFHAKEKLKIFFNC